MARNMGENPTQSRSKSWATTKKKRGPVYWFIDKIDEGEDGAAHKTGWDDPISFIIITQQKRRHPVVNNPERDEKSFVRPLSYLGREKKESGANY